MFCKLVFETKYFLAEWTRMVSRLVVGCGQMLLQAVTMRKYLKNMINVWFMSFGQGVEFRDYLNAQTEIQILKRLYITYLSTFVAHDVTIIFGRSFQGQPHVLNCYVDFKIGCVVAFLATNWAQLSFSFWCMVMFSTQMTFQKIHLKK